MQRFAVAVVVQSKGFVDLAVVNLCVGAHLYIGAWVCDRRLVFAGRLGVFLVRSGGSVVCVGDVGCPRGKKERRILIMRRVSKLVAVLAAAGMLFSGGGLSLRG